MIDKQLSALICGFVLDSPDDLCLLGAAGTCWRQLAFAERLS